MDTSAPLTPSFFNSLSGNKCENVDKIVIEWDEVGL